MTTPTPSTSESGTTSGALTDSYISATLRSVPRRQRAEIERELRASIADDVEGRIEQGASPKDAEFAALDELGEPARLAANYSGRPLTLIGPNTFTGYVATLKIVVGATVPIVLIALVAVGLSQHHPLATTIAGALSVGVTVAVYLAVCLTIAFALIDRAATRNVGPARRGGIWSPKYLPVDNRPAQKSWGESVASVIFTVILVAAVAIQRTESPVATSGGVPIQILAPSLWDFWLPYFLVVLLLGVALDFVRLGIGRWHPVTTAMGTLLTLAGAVPFIALAYESKIVNPALWHAVGHTEWTTPGNWLSLIIAIFVGLVALGNVIDEWRRGSRARRA
jgi:hypothetical protein